MVELVRAGRKPAELSKEFGPTPWSISLWVKQEARDSGRGDDGLSTEERSELSRLRRENRQLKEEREILSKAAAWFANEELSETEALFGFVKANQATYPVRVMCRLLKISKSGFYAWLHRPMSNRARSDIALTAKIHAIHRRSREAYGAPMIHAELADDHGVHVGRKRVARLMRLAGLRGVQTKRFVRTTTADAYSAVGG
jgi:transposase-like protein